MTDEPDLDDIKRRMAGAIENLRHEFQGLRTGRASAALLEPITVSVYEMSMPLNQVATISVPEARLLSVQVWDQNNVGAVEKAIRTADLGLNPLVEGNIIRIPIPELNEERRTELGKIAHKYAEQARVSVRNVRRHGMDYLKKAEKEDHMGEDEHKMWAEEIQSMTDKTITGIDELLDHKEKEIMQV